MMKRILDFVSILLFVWVTMIGGLLFINIIIIPLELGGPLLTSLVQAVTSTVLVVLWLWVWRKIMKKVFWRILRKQSAYIKNQVNHNGIKK